MADISTGQLKVLEKLIGDEEFRTSFFEDPDAAVAKAGIDLTEEELAKIKAIDISIIDSAIADIGARISKTGMSGAGTASGVVQSVFGQFFTT